MMSSVDPSTSSAERETSKRAAEESPRVETEGSEISSGNLTMAKRQKVDEGSDKDLSMSPTRAETGKTEMEQQAHLECANIRVRWVVEDDGDEKEEDGAAELKRDGTNTGGTTSAPSSTQQERDGERADRPSPAPLSDSVCQTASAKASEERRPSGPKESSGKAWAVWWPCTLKALPLSGCAPAQQLSVEKEKENAEVNGEEERNQQEEKQRDSDTLMTAQTERETKVEGRCCAERHAKGRRVFLACYPYHETPLGPFEATSYRVVVVEPPPEDRRGSGSPPGTGRSGLSQDRTEREVEAGSPGGAEGKEKTKKRMIIHLKEESEKGPCARVLSCEWRFEDDGPPCKGGRWEEELEEYDPPSEDEAAEEDAEDLELDYWKEILGPRDGQQDSSVSGGTNAGAEGAAGALTLGELGERMDAFDNRVKEYVGKNMEEMSEDFLGSLPALQAQSIAGATFQWIEAMKDAMHNAMSKKAAESAPGSKVVMSVADANNIVEEAMGKLKESRRQEEEARDRAPFF